MNLFMTVGSQSGSHRPVLDSLSLCSCSGHQNKKREGGGETGEMARIHTPSDRETRLLGSRVEMSCTLLFPAECSSSVIQ